jgi:Tol biopolymer transport system component
MRRFILAVATATATATTLVAAPSNAAYVGQEGKIAFVRSNQIYTVAKTGGPVTKLTNSAKNYRPKWSPDGRRIAFIHEAAGSKDVWVMKANGTGKTQVTHLGTVSAAAVWSPDGKTLAFGAGPASIVGAQMFTIKATEPFGAPVSLPQAYSPSIDGPVDVLVDRFLAWSPDGTHINYFNNDSENSPDHAIHSLNLSTNVETVLNATGGSCCGFAEWTDLAFGSTGVFGYAELDEGEFGDGPFSQKIIYPGFVSAEGDVSPVPSSSNAHMAFVNASSGTPKVYVATITGANRHVIVTNGYTPDWQPLP